MHTQATQVLLVATFLVLSGCDDQQAEAPASATADQPAASAPMAVPRTASPEGASVFFITPSDGDTVSSPVRIEFGIDGMSVVAAGTDQAHSGHHHLLVDTGLPDLGAPIPADAAHIHFGDASTATELTLEPGEHTLQLLFADHLHIPHDPPVYSERIRILVE